MELEMSRGENTTAQAGLWRKMELWSPGALGWDASTSLGSWLWLDGALPMSGPVGDQTCAGRISQAARCGAG